MIKYLFPNSIGNDYKGNKIPLYLFYLVTSFTIIRSVIHIFSPDGGAQSIATIPLHLYPKNASDTIIHLFAQWGLSQLLLGLLYIVVLIKYRSLIPLMYLFLVVEYSIRLFLGFYKPFVLAGIAPGGVGNYFLVPFFVVMYILSVQQKRQ
jgi:hypothetical protein